MSEEPTQEAPRFLVLKHRVMTWPGFNSVFELKWNNFLPMFWSLFVWYSWWIHQFSNNHEFAQAEFCARVIIVRERMTTKEQEINGMWMTKDKMRKSGDFSAQDGCISRNLSWHIMQYMQSIFIKIYLLQRSWYWLTNYNRSISDCKSTILHQIMCSWLLKSSPLNVPSSHGSGTA